MKKQGVFEFLFILMQFDKKGGIFIFKKEKNA